MARKRRPLPIELRRARIESVDPRGRGIALVDERRVHLPSSLPGELVEFRYTRRARRSDDGRVERVLEAAPERVVPKCDYFDVCGGCRNQHVAHPRQIASAQADLLERLESGGISPSPTCAPSSRSTVGIPAAGSVSGAAGAEKRRGIGRVSGEDF